MAEERLYPAEHHFRIIVEAGSRAHEDVRTVLGAFAVTSPLSAGGRSSGGRYETLQVSVRFGSREEHVRLDGALRAVAGVKVLL